MQIMLSKAVSSSIAEVADVISDTRLRIKSEFHTETEKNTNFVREKVEEAKSQGIDGLTFKTLPYVDQNEMYHHVYQRLREGHCIAIYPEGKCPFKGRCIGNSVLLQAVAMTEQIFFL